MITTGYDLSTILGAQLRSVLEAETDNAQAIAEFITTVGFEKRPGDSGIGRLRMISFDMMRRNEVGGLDKHTVSIPLLSILPIPMLSIDKADFEFDLEVRDVAEVKRSVTPSTLNSSKAERKSLFASFSARKRVKTPSTPSNTRSYHREANMSVKVSVVQTDFPLGVEKLLNLSELGIHDVDNGE
ncbi:DUF2589 domain-containing protein [Vibrio parahaemolyticus]|uniref:DUF2589 domain-containing protein n=1 Tax=Vibrio mediterranei TaxID=689 RepID=UPI0040678FC7